MLVFRIYYAQMLSHDTVRIASTPRLVKASTAPSGAEAQCQICVLQTTLENLGLGMWRVLDNIPKPNFGIPVSDYGRTSTLRNTIEEASSCKLTISEFLEAWLGTHTAGLLAWACGASVA